MKGSGEGVLRRVLKKGVFYGFCSKKGFWEGFSEGGSEKAVSRRCLERPLVEYAPLGVRPTKCTCAFASAFRIVFCPHLFSICEALEDTGHGDNHGRMSWVRTQPFRRGLLPSWLGIGCGKSACRGRKACAGTLMLHNHLCFKRTSRSETKTYLGNWGAPTTPDPNTFPKASDTNGSRSVIQIGGACTTFCQEGGVLLQKHRDTNGRGVARYFSEVSGAECRHDIPERIWGWGGGGLEWGSWGRLLFIQCGCWEELCSLHEGAKPRPKYWGWGLEEGSWSISRLRSKVWSLGNISFMPSCFSGLEALDMW